MTIWPRLIALGLVTFGLGISCAEAGELRRLHSPLGALIGAAVRVYLLWKCDFFAALGWPA